MSSEPTRADRAAEAMARSFAVYADLLAAVVPGEGGRTVREVIDAAPGEDEVVVSLSEIEELGNMLSAADPDDQGADGAFHLVKAIRERLLARLSERPEVTP